MAQQIDVAGSHCMTPQQYAAKLWNVDERTLTATNIKHGLTNESYRVSGGVDSVVVRLSNTDVQALQINRENESLVLKLVEQEGIGAPVLLNQPDLHVLITRELQGSNPTMEGMKKSENIVRVAALLTRLHALRESESIQCINLESTLKGYSTLLDSHNAAAYDRALVIARESDSQTIRALCHNDVHHLNLIDNGERFWLLDWEYAGMGDPFFDLASVCCYHNFDATQRSVLLSSYLSTAILEDYARLDRMCWLFDYIKEMWFAVRHSLDAHLQK